MPRQFGSIPTTIWRDDDFRTLPVATQHVIMMVDSQENISACGVIPLSLTRWAGRAADLTRESIIVALADAQDHGWIAFDEDTEEVVLRPYMLWDQGYTNVKRRPVIERAAAQVESPTLQKVLAVELEKLGLPGVWAFGESTDDDKPTDPPSLFDTEPHTVSATVSHTVPRSNSDLVGVKNQSPTPTPTPTPTPFPNSHHPPPSGRLRSPSSHPTAKWSEAEIETDPLWQRFYAAFPKHEAKGKAKQAWLTALRKRDPSGAPVVTPEQLIEAAAAYRNSPRRSPDPKFTKHPATWLNQECWADEETVAPARRRSPGHLDA